jgi:hypothetical protein
MGNSGEPLWLSGKVIEWENKQKIKRSQVRSPARATVEKIQNGEFYNLSVVQVLVLQFFISRHIVEITTWFSASMQVVLQLL